MDEIEIIDENLCELDSAASSAAERMIAHLRDLARYLVEETGAFSDSAGNEAEDDVSDGGEHEMYFIPDALRELYRREAVREFDVPKSVNARGLCDWKKCVCIFERVTLCREITDLYKMGSNPPITERLMRAAAKNPPYGSPSHGRISYLRNSYADTAYALFARLADNVRVTYCTDFSAVCEDVYYGRSQYCILPIENSVDGTLAGFRALITKYDLRIAATCFVERSEYNVAKFALLSKNLGYLPLPDTMPASTQIKCENYFEFHITLRGADSLSELLCAADCFGLHTGKIETLPGSTSYGYSDGECTYGMTFAIDGAELDAFVGYLILESTQWTAMGLYPQIKEIRTK